jgi:hypothetical protein
MRTATTGKDGKRLGGFSCIMTNDPVICADLEQISTDVGLSLICKEFKKGRKAHNSVKSRLQESLRMTSISGKMFFKTSLL